MYKKEKKLKNQNLTCVGEEKCGIFFIWVSERSLQKVV